MKKIQRKTKQDGEKNADKESIKDEKSVKQESPNSDNGPYIGMDITHSFTMY